MKDVTLHYPRKKMIFSLLLYKPAPYSVIYQMLEITTSRSLLHNISEYSIIQSLLQKGADPDHQDSNGQSPLHVQTDLKIIELLLAYGANPDIKDKQGNTPLHIHSNNQIIYTLICFSADVNVINKSQQTPLHLHNDKIITSLLLINKADANIRDKQGRTALWYNPNLELLLEHGAQPNITDDEGQTILHQHWRSAEEIELMLNYGANPHINDNFGNTPLYYHRNPLVISLLIKHGSRADNKDELGRYLFFHSLDSLSLMMILDYFLRLYPSLLQPTEINKSIINHKDVYGKTALDYCVDINDQESIQLLRRYGAT